jgi:hypothetical protein
MGIGHIDATLVAWTPPVPHGYSACRWPSPSRFGGPGADRFSGGPGPGTDAATDITATKGDTYGGTIPDGRLPPPRQRESAEPAGKAVTFSRFLSAVGSLPSGQVHQQSSAASPSCRAVRIMLGRSRASRFR